PLPGPRLPGPRRGPRPAGAARRPRRLGARDARPPRGGGGVTSAPERIRRLMAVVPWVVEQGGASIDELCDRFAVSRDELVADLERFSMTGVHPYTPDAMNELLITDDWVTINVGPWFRRPLSLTHDQAVGVLAAASALASTPGASSDGALGRALE